MIENLKYEIRPSSRVRKQHHEAHSVQLSLTMTTLPLTERPRASHFAWLSDDSFLENRRYWTAVQIDAHALIHPQTSVLLTPLGYYVHVLKILLVLEIKKSKF